MAHESTSTRSLERSTKASSSNNGNTQSSEVICAFCIGGGRGNAFETYLHVLLSELSVSHMASGSYSFGTTADEANGTSASRQAKEFDC